MGMARFLSLPVFGHAALSPQHVQGSLATAAPRLVDLERQLHSFQQQRPEQM